MKYIVLLMATFIFATNISLADMNVELNVIRSANFIASAVYKNKVCLLGYNNEGKWIEYFDGKMWSTIPLYLKSKNGSDDTIKVDYDTGRRVAFDNQGSIWLCAQLGLYKYDGTTWIKYSLNDEYADRRKFTNITFAPNGVAYVTAEYPKLYYYDGNTRIIDKYTTTLMKFDGATFSIVDTTEGGLSGLASDGGFHLLKNGKLLVHIYYSGVPQLFENNLYVYDTHIGDSKLIQTLYNPHSLSNSGKFKSSVYVNNIFEDKDGNIWFSLGGGLQDDEGAVVWRNDNSWEVVKVPMRYNYFRPNKSGDSIYYPISSIQQDNLNQLWIGGAVVLNKISPDLTLRQFDKMDFLDNLTIFTIARKSSPSFFAVDSIVKYLSDITCNCLVNNYSPMHPAIVSRMETTEDGSLWYIIDGLGAVRYKPVQTSVEEGDGNNLFVIHSSGEFSDDRVINITLNDPLPIEGVALYNLNGHRVYSENFGASKEKQFEVMLPLNNIAAGVYIVSINLKDKSFLKKIIIY